MTYIVYIVCMRYAAQYTTAHTIDYSKSIGSVHCAHSRTRTDTRKQTHDRN